MLNPLIAAVLPAVGKLLRGKLTNVGAAGMMATGVATVVAAGTVEDPVQAFENFVQAWELAKPALIALGAFAASVVATIAGLFRKGGNTREYREGTPS